MTDRQDRAADRLSLLHVHLHDGVPLASAARDAGVPIRTARRWLARFRDAGPVGLATKPRSDAGARRIRRELVELIEGLAFTKPRRSAAAIHRRAAAVARERGWRAPSPSTVHAIMAGLDPAALTLAHEGEAAFRDRYELVHRHRAERPNATWQADHTELDILILDANGKEARPWLTTVIDDHSRALAGYMVFLGAPSALNTSLALRQAIWRKVRPDWHVCGVPDVLYVDHGSDFTSNHLEQAAVDLRIRLVFSAVARPQGRGKVERLFGTINTELLAELPGALHDGAPTSRPRLSLAELDAMVGEHMVSVYNHRSHREIGAAPIDAWRGNGWLPRMPDTLEELDLLLVMVAKSRTVHRDGIRFQGLRYFDPTLAGFVGEPVAIRFDPRDMGEVRVFHRNRFLCRAVSPEEAGRNITLKDVQAARGAHRRALRDEIRDKRARVAEYLPLAACLPARVLPPPRPVPKSASTPTPAARRPRLRTYLADE